METRFILNNRDIVAHQPPGTPLLDFIRVHSRLTGTKIGCREGDCGACAILVGHRNQNGEMQYQSMTSCLMPLCNAAGKHIVTVEGLNLASLSPVQSAIVQEGATQCGFCTPGFVVSLTGFCITEPNPSPQSAIAAMDGNICRCTGYKSLERAGGRIARLLADKDHSKPVSWLVKKGFLPQYFQTIPQRLADMETNAPSPTGVFVGGGTDLFVQKPEAMARASVLPLLDRQDLKGIREEGDQIWVGAASTASDLRNSALMNQCFPAMQAHMKLVSSTPIRNMGSVAGNFVNASPIGDLTIFFLALGGELQLKTQNGDSRKLPLNQFYKGYKDLDLRPGELVEAVAFAKPGDQTLFNFEKVCKRTHLDIASVNTAIRLDMTDGVITGVGLSAGGVAPIPLFLAQTADYLKGRSPDGETVARAAQIAMDEATPISDARGTAQYKKLLLRQLIYAHFTTLFPETIALEALV